MVGVPRSKGCLTCRRRKVACGQEKPQCSNCTKRGTQCEGYARYPTILQYTGSGLKRRTRLEEARVSVTPSTTALAVRHQASDASASWTQPPALNRQYLAQISASCISTYLQTASSGDVVSELKSNWMWNALDLADRGLAFEASIAALCFGRVGLVNKDAQLLSRAREQYTIGLNALQLTLRKPEAAFRDRTLAAIRTLSIYELWSMPWSDASKANVHEQGMLQWCRAAGPESINSEFALHVFYDVRWCILNRAIDGRQGSMLGESQWTTIPWLLFPKDSLQLLFDIGFELAALLERLDLCESPQLPETSVSKRARIYLSCATVQDSLHDWYRENWSGSGGNTPSSSGSADRLSPENSPGSAHTEFSKLWEATNIVYFWLFQMILNEIKIATAPQEEQEDLVFYSLELAVNIVSASTFFLADATGWLGPQRLFFPLRRALGLLIAERSPFADDAREAFGKLVAKLRSDCNQ